MIDLTREMVAYAIIGAVVLTVLPFVLTMRRRRHQEKLRRRGIKRHGH